VIVAATNHPDLLDPALFRRFDDVVEYSLPTGDLAHEAFRSRLQGLGTADVDWQIVVGAANGLSYADIVKACEDAAKEAILGDTETVATESLLRALEDRRFVRRRPPQGDRPIESAERS
jgi:SpoVK/Ycf46/Vps4 family AAA+-type ATPase